MTKGLLRILSAYIGVKWCGRDFYMEILKKNIRMSRRKSHAVNQVTLEEDMNVPDVMPDALEIIQHSGKMKIEDSKILDDQIVASGYLEAAVLYLADGEEHQVHRLLAKLPFTEKLNLEGVRAGDTVSLKWEVEDIRVHLINSRKISIQALVAFEAAVEELYDTQAAVEVQGIEELSVKKKELHPLSMAVQKKDIFRVKEEIQLASNKPNIGEILWDSVQLRTSGMRLNDGALELHGELFVFVLYAADDEKGTKQWIETALPFQGELACSGCQAGMLPDIEISLAESSLEIRPDYDGEERVIQMDAVLELDIHLYEEDTVSILEDVYAPAKELTPVFGEEIYESLLVKNHGKCKASGRMRISETKPRLLQICHASGEVKVDEAKQVEGGIQMEGAAAVSLLYVTADDSRPFALMEGVIPFSHFMEADGLKEGCRFKLQPELEQLSASMVDSEEVEIKCSMQMKLFAVEVHHQNCILDIEEKELDLQTLQDMPGIVCYVVQPGDSLWNIAKQYRTTPERIRERNQIKTEEVQPGQRLILVKTALLY